MASNLILVRHGETEWSKSLRHTSVTDLSLTENGQAAASALGPRLAAFAPDIVFSSPRKRALETAALALPNATPVIDEDIVEWNYGDYEGITTADILANKDKNWYLWTDGCPNGESPAEVAKRADRFIQRVEAIEGNVMAFAHGHILRVLVARWLEMDVAEGNRFSLSTASISVLNRARGLRVIQHWNT